MSDIESTGDREVEDAEDVEGHRRKHRDAAPITDQSEEDDVEGHRRKHR